VLGGGGVLPGLGLRVPRGWHGVENDQGELHLTPPRDPNESVFVWRGNVAVRSTGTGHGTVLPGVGRTAAALVQWLSTNHDLTIFRAAHRAQLARGWEATELSLEVSPSARYGDAGCPSNPRCADIFTNPGYWGGSSYGIGAPEAVTLFLSTIDEGSRTDTVIVALDGLSRSALRHLATVAEPVLRSLRVPSGSAVR
jgi:hypothetical protein